LNYLSLKDFKNFFPKRNESAYKGMYGKVLVIGGSDEFIGAPALSALSALGALRSGVDIVAVCAPEKAGYVINSFSPDLIVKKIPGKNFSGKNLDKVFKVAKQFDSVLIGPGIGLKKETRHFVQRLVKKLMREKIPLIIDADAIKSLQKTKFNGNVLITPHKTELEIFFGKKLEKESFDLIQRIKTVQLIAKKFNCIILLKGKIDVISDGKIYALNKTGNPGMTVGGTGDILAGLCAGLNCASNNLFNSACFAAYVNGLAGDKQLKKKGKSFIASDLLEEIPKIMKKIDK
jgi:hydroxyethylthiazole kinase-like uncharacterized protein yjeF